MVIVNTQSTWLILENTRTVMMRENHFSIVKVCICELLLSRQKEKKTLLLSVRVLNSEFLLVFWVPMNNSPLNYDNLSCCDLDFFSKSSLSPPLAPKEI